MDVFHNIKLANWFLEKGISEGRFLTQMRLQKLLYFAHALSVSGYNVPLVLGQFEAWRFGPVLPDLYVYTKGYGEKPINTLIHVPSQNPLSLAIPRISKKDETILEVLESTWKNYSQLSSEILSKLSQEETSPWDLTFNGKGVGVSLDDKLISEFYKNRLK